jgi:hydrogenase nickel incorporation protein HypA/HybF
MHELSITQQIVELATAAAQGSRVYRLTLEIGALTALEAESIRFCFDICAQGTALAGADLEIIERPGLGQCRQCGATLGLSQPYGVCTCGSTALTIIQGEELAIKELEVEDLCV